MISFSKDYDSLYYTSYHCIFRHLTHYYVEFYLLECYLVTNIILCFGTSWLSILRVKFSLKFSNSSSSSAKNLSCTSSTESRACFKPRLIRLSRIKLILRLHHSIRGLTISSFKLLVICFDCLLSFSQRMF